MKNMLNFTLIGILSFLIFSGFANSEIQEISTDEVVHKRFHVTGGSVSIKANKVVLTDPNGSFTNKEFACTAVVKRTSNIILQDRPSGSEVFVIIKNDVVTEMDICHKHDGVVLECGEAL